MRRFVVAAAFAALTFAAASPARAQLGGAPPPLPDGEGKDIVAVACSQCHTMAVTLTMRAGLNGWRHQVYDMVLRGAQITVPDAEIVVRYLATNFGPGTPLPGARPDPVALPAGAGKELVEANCGMCHDLGRMTGVKRARSEWEGIVARMIHLGSPADAEDAKKIVAYLDAQFGKK
jgi:cytochrome c5